MTLEDRVRLKARLINKELEINLQKALVEQAESPNRCWRPEGCVIAVTSLLDIQDTLNGAKGKIDNDDGSVVYNVKYRAVVFRPLYKEGEVLPCTVEAVDQIVISARCGPLSVAISAHNIPSDFVFDASEPGNPKYRSDEAGYTIHVGAVIKVRLISPNDKSNIVGTLMGQFLG